MGRNEDLVKRVQDGETDLMGELWENNTGLVAFVARRYQECCGRLVDWDDLMQAGYLGLYAAAMTYSAERAAFSTFAVLHLRRAMRQVAGLRGKRDALFDACPLDAPLGDDEGGMVSASWADGQAKWVGDFRHLRMVELSAGQEAVAPASTASMTGWRSACMGA